MHISPDIPEWACIFESSLKAEPYSDSRWICRGLTSSNSDLRFCQMSTQTDELLLGNHVCKLIEYIGW